MALEMNRLIFPKKLCNKFPTKLDTLRAFLYERQIYLDSNLSKKNPPISIIADVVVNSIKSIYSKAGLATLRKDIIKGKVLKVYRSRNKLLKFARSQRYSEIFLKKKEQFESIMSETLEVADLRQIKENKKSAQISNLNSVPDMYVRY